MEALHMKSYNALRDAFLSCSEADHPYSIMRITLPIDTQELKMHLMRKKRLGVPCVIPELMHTSDGDLSTVEIYETYARIFDIAKQVGIGIAFHLESGLEKLIINGDCDESTDLAARNLTMYTYRCIDREQVRYTLHSGRLMSIVAYDGNFDIIDLRPYLDGKILSWDSPGGKWDILEFSCVPDEDSGRVNYLNYNSSLSYISMISEELTSMADGKKPDALCSLKFSDVGFITKNRRMWTDDFNERFCQLYGFDPAPYYPVLFFNTGEDTARLKAQFMDCRAKMLANGFVKAAHDFAGEFGIECISGFISTKFSACSMLTGDNLLVNSYSPCALLGKAYMYGINSVKIAAGAGYNFDRQTINCDIFKDYDEIDFDVAYKESMHAFARGVNRLILHSPAIEESGLSSLFRTLGHGDDVEDYFNFSTRVQSVLKGGKHVSDIAVLYPIYSIHSGVYFYDYDVEGFEYPDTKNMLDYMNVINSISFYSGHDVTVLHPNALQSYCHTRNGNLYLDNGSSRECYSVMVLPATNVISIKTLELVKEFFDGGGKIIATGELPEHAIESTPDNNVDKRVKELVFEIFGKDAANINIMREYSENRNENGGIAYMLYFSLTAADGTNMVDSKLIRRALDSFRLPYDITITDMPRYESTGALNTVYPIFKKLGLSHHLPNGGMINRIHKRRGDTEIYYVSNTMTSRLDSPIVLRGRMSIEEWDPHTEKIKKLSPTFFTESFGSGSVTFTQFHVELEPSRSAIYIGTPIQ